MTTSYEKLPGLAGFYFEDSYVLDITETPDTLSFALDIVLTEDHPAYRPPPPDEAYCYRHGTLTFAGFREVEWLERSEANYTDVTGEVDHGNIDSFVSDGGSYVLVGDWGRVRIAGGTYDVVLEGGDPAPETAPATPASATDAGPAPVTPPSAPVSADELRNLLIGLASFDAKQRAGAADRAVEVSGAVPSDGVEPLARALVDAAAIESAPDALESQVNALNALSSAQPFDRAIVAPLLGLDRSRLGGSAREAIDALAAYYRGG
jgi:hypothetical protein